MTTASTIRARRSRQRELQTARTERDRALDEALAARLKAQVAREEDQHAWLKPAVLSAVVTLVVTLLTGSLALRGTYFGADENRAKENREKQAEVYAEYLASAREYDGILRSYEANEEDQPDDSSSHQVAEAFLPQLREAEKELSKSADLIFVYGSDEAWATHQQFAKHMPDLRVTIGRIPRESSLERISVLYRFQGVFCREVPAKPRDGCPDAGDRILPGEVRTYFVTATPSPTVPR